MAAKMKKITVQAKVMALEAFKGDVLALGLFKDTKKLPAEYDAVDKAAGGVIGRLIKTGDFKAGANETTVLYPQGGNCARIMLVGLGAEKECTAVTMRQAAGTAIRQADGLTAGSLALGLLVLKGIKVDARQAGSALAEGAIIGGYDYQDYLPEKRRSKVAAVRVVIPAVDAAQLRGLQKGIALGVALGEGQNLARIIANTPGNEINPPLLATFAARLARQSGLKCTIYNDRQLAKMGMNTILAVGQGSMHKPRLIRLEYKGNKRSKGYDVAVVGKAITFDSGGISIKPSQDMDTMKYDKSGGCATLGIITTAARLKLPLNILALVPAAENMPGGGSYRPGDIIRSYNGKTIEVLNTDAEGRLILSDALALAAELKPGAIIDLATLTGAVVVALGQHHAGLFGNNDKLIGAVKAASEKAGEPMWHLPCGGEYLEQTKSKMADLVNTGGRPGGASTAASFLQQFVGDTPWAHIDIAAVSDTTEAKSWRGRGATGYAVRTVLEYLMEKAR